MQPHDTSRYAKRSGALRRVYKSLRRAADLRATDLAHPGRTRAIYRVFPYTMLPFARLRNAYECMRAVERERIPGAVVECGVWAGGCIGLMAGMSKAAGDRERVFHLFDSFEGVPQPSVHDVDVLERFAEEYPELEPDRGDGRSELVPIGICSAPLERVKELFFEVLGIEPAQVVVHKGWFQETVPAEAAGIGPIALLRLDGDWHESTRVCLEHLYDRVVPGGFVIIDDYGCFSGCTKATDDFFAARGSRPELVDVDGECVFLRKA
jgi:O-methyltransferase